MKSKKEWPVYEEPSVFNQDDPYSRPHWLYHDDGNSLNVNIEECILIGKYVDILFCLFLY